MQHTEITPNSSTFNLSRKLLFIVNPNAGKKIWEEVTAIIRKEFQENTHYQIAIWKDKDHFEEITQDLKTEGYTDAIAVGGDGTVNQVAKTLVNTDITLGIVPVGSGNGLARSLGLSMNPEEVIKQIAKGKTATIDYGTVNGRPFFCTSGVGFDAHIGNLFAKSVKRGLKSYINITAQELLHYRSKNYTLTFDNKTIQRKAFLIAVANGGQYGNNFYIAPEADLQDGKFHVAILKPFNPIQALGILTNILRRKAHLSRKIETYSTDKITIVRENKGSIHFDGEPAIEEKEVVYEIKPKALKVIVGDNF